MARKPRIISPTGVYHVMSRGVGKMTIFPNNSDKRKYVKSLVETNEKCSFDMYAYCLMKNHTHLLIKENETDLSTVMQSLNTKYAEYFNIKYNRVGHVFQGRFLSEPIKDERYFLGVVRYIHKNPVKASICAKCCEYDWSSYNHYANPEKVSDLTKHLIKTSEVKSYFAGLDSFEKFHKEDKNEEFLEYSKNIVFKDSDVKIIINEITKKLLLEKEYLSSSDKNKLNREGKRNLFRVLKKDYPEITSTQLSKLYRITRTTIRKLL